VTPGPRGSDSLIPLDDVSVVATVGTGVIGAGWAVHFLAHGYDVVAYDPDPDAEKRLNALVARAWPALTWLGLADGASTERLRFTTSIEEAVSDAGFVQESGPESPALKQALLAELDAATAPSVVIASSTSGLSMTTLSVRTAHPERFVVGHPFNPPYLIPLVEVCGGERTSAETVRWAADLYTQTGKTPLVLSNELSGFIGNRLQEAIWREALHMVAAGEATVEQLDLAITEGPGLRWALMGPCLTFHLAGGEQGMGHMLDHFGDSLQEPWTRLAAPQLTPELYADLVSGCQDEAGDRSVAGLEAERDAFLVELLKLRRRFPTYGLTSALAAEVETAAVGDPV
jgi:carnitine 3-dehydrogenase